MGDFQLILLGKAKKRVRKSGTLERFPLSSSWRMAEWAWRHSMSISLPSRSTARTRFPG